MAAYAKCNLYINGQNLNTLRNYEFGEQKYSDTVKLMNGTTYKDTEPIYTFTFDTVPKTPANLTDWNTLIDGTVTINVKLKNGQTRVHSNCRCMSVKESRIDGETELSQTITVFAEKINYI